MSTRPSQTALLAFHLARARRSGEPDEPNIKVSRWMFNAYPQDIRMWLQEKGGVEKMPFNDFWYLLPSELWQMGYRKCEGKRPQGLR